MGEFSCFFAIPPNLRSKQFYKDLDCKALSILLNPKSLINKSAPAKQWLGRNVGSPIASNVISLATKITLFIKNNWIHLILFAVAGGVIVGGVGLMYGFEAVSLPLVIGFACGLPVGLLSGVIVVKWIDPNGELEYNTIWGLVNAGLNKLPANGARPIVISIAVTVILAASAVFPLIMGIGLGILIGNHLGTKVGLEKDFGPDGAHEKALKLREQVNQLTKEMENIQAELSELIDEDGI